MKKRLLKFSLGFSLLVFGQGVFAQTYTFTNCGATGAQGPDSSQVANEYLGTTLDGDVTINNQGIQEWTVPVSAVYQISTIGAQGGKTIDTQDSLRGGGATMVGEFSLTAGQVLKVVVGQEGLENASGNTANGGGRGGGGSFVWVSTDTLPLIVAGGGGGGSIINITAGNSVSNCKGKGAPITNDGLPSYSEEVNYGINGGDAQFGDEPALGWTTMFNSLDFSGSTLGSHGGIGGFGGGGTGADGTPHAGGGGGGFSGGGGGRYSTNSGFGNTDGRNGGGGGGSYNTGSNQNNTAGNNFGMGLVEITLLCDAPVTGVVNQTECDSVMLFGTMYYSSQTVYDTMPNGASDGCDSITQVNLTITNGSSTLDVVYSTCASSYFVGGATQTVNGIYTDTYTAQNGCDSVVNTELTLNADHTTYYANESICDGESIMLGGANQTMSGVYYDTIATAGACDSILATVLNVLTSPTTIINESIASGETYTFAGTDYSTTGTYTETYTAANGCDSTVTLNLTVGASNINSIDLSNINIYPNPTNGELFVEKGNSDRLTIELIDLSGKTLLVKEIKGDKQMIDMSSFESGVYFMNLRSEEKVSTRRIMLK